MENFIKLIAKHSFRVYGKAVNDLLAGKTINRKFYQLIARLDTSTALEPFEVIIKCLQEDIIEFTPYSVTKRSSFEPHSVKTMTLFISFENAGYRSYVTLKLTDDIRQNEYVTINDALYYTTKGFNIDGLEGHPDSLLDLIDAEHNKTLLILKKHFNLPIYQAHRLVNSINASYEEGYSHIKFVDYMLDWKPRCLKVKKYPLILDDLVRSFVISGFELRGDAARRLFMYGTLKGLFNREVIDFVAPDYGVSFSHIIIAILNMFRVTVCHSYPEQDRGINLHCMWSGMKLPRIRICTDTPFDRVETSINNSLLWFRDPYNRTIIHPSMFFRTTEDTYGVSGDEDVTSLFAKSEGSKTDYRSIHFFKSMSYSPEYKVLCIHKSLCRGLNRLCFFDRLMSLLDY